MPIDFSQLQAELNRDADVNNSAATLISRLLDGVAEANRQGQAAVDQFVAQARANNDALAAAVAAGTPSQPTTTPEPGPQPEPEPGQ